MKQLQEKYDVKFQGVSDGRRDELDNSEKLDDARAVIMPQGQHIGISETTYKELNKAPWKEKVKNESICWTGKDLYYLPTG